MEKVVFDIERCKGCELCTTVCPRGIVIIYPITGGIITGLPGIILQFVIVPPTVYFIEKSLAFKGIAND